MARLCWVLVCWWGCEFNQQSGFPPYIYSMCMRVGVWIGGGVIHFVCCGAHPTPEPLGRQAARHGPYDKETRPIDSVPNPHNPNNQIDHRLVGRSRFGLGRGPGWIDRIGLPGGVVSTSARQAAAHLTHARTPNRSFRKSIHPFPRMVDRIDPSIDQGSVPVHWPACLFLPWIFLPRTDTHSLRESSNGGVG